MCNLYNAGPSQNEDQSRWAKQVREAVERIPKACGIRKTDPGLTVFAVDDGYECEVMRWGFDRPFNPAVNNARADKLDGGMWKNAFAERRCLVPVAAFYEWTGPKGDKRTHAFVSEREEWLWVAGLWEEHPEHGRCYTMITTGANELMEPIHNRMPAILPEEAAAAFLAGDLDSTGLRPAKVELRTFPCANPLKTRRFGPPEPVSVQGDLF